MTGLPFSWLGFGGAAGASGRCTAAFNWAGFVATAGGVFFGTAAFGDSGCESSLSLLVGGEAILSGLRTGSTSPSGGAESMSSVAFFVTAFAGRGGMAGTSFVAFFCGRAGALFEAVERGGRGGGFEGDGTSTKSPVATGVISALDVGRPSLRKSEAGTGGGARRLGS